MFKVVLTIVIVICLFSLVFPGTTGKISGLVKDKSNGEPLVGVNVIVDGTFLGASSDIDGYFTILNVPAGNYTININYVGYQTVTYQNIRIVPDITKRINVEMQETTIEMAEEILVVADRPFFEQSATNTVRVLDSEEIQRVPVKGVNQVIAINAGVVVSDGDGGDLDNAMVNVRGGRGNETLIVIDGIPQNDGMYGNAAGSVPDAAIEQISSQIGGFSAKYGSAQSGVINIVTKGGNPKYFGSFEGVSSNITDDYNYNQATGSVGGPIIPDYNKINFFLSGEYVTTDDIRPRASGLTIPTANIDTKVRDNMDGKILRLSGKINGQITNNLKATLSGNASFRDSRIFILRYAKNNSEHYPKIEEDVIGASIKLSQVFDETSFLDAIVRFRDQKFQRGDGFWYEDLLAYGDSTINETVGITLPADGNQVRVDDNGVYWEDGRTYNQFRKYRMQKYGFDLNYTKQYKNHFIELGGTVEQNTVRFFQVSPVQLGLQKDARTLEERYYAGMVTYWGYDILGNEISGKDKFRTISDDRYEEAGPKKPLTVAFYFQDKIEFDDFILNFGFRWDYFDPDFNRIKDITKVLGDDGVLTADDYEKAPSESYISPRIGFAYPITERTAFHAQYGVFRQQPRYIDLYDSWINIDDLESMDGQGQNLGHLIMEQTTQYEFGFKHQIGNFASLDVTAFYKNIKNLTNQSYSNFTYGQTENSVIGMVNADFGTIKGLAFAFNLRKIGPLSAKIDYTLEQAEGTGSSSTSSFVSAFRSSGNKTPLAIAPLDFEQTHTLTANFDIRAGNDEGPSIAGIKPLENTGANFLVTYTSGRPYTPLASLNIIDGYTRYGNLTQYVNSAVFDGIFRVDLKIDKRINFGDIGIVPYLWVQNLFDRENFVDVWQSTGEPDDTAFLDTPAGEQIVRGRGEFAEGYASDYQAIEKDPRNYGLPRVIRLGVRVDF